MMLSTSRDALSSIAHAIAATLNRRHETAIRPTIVRLIAQLLPAQTGEYLMLMTSLPIAVVLPAWATRLAEAAFSPIASLRAVQR